MKPDPELDDAMANALKTKSEDDEEGSGEVFDFGKGLIEPSAAEVKVEEFWLWEFLEH